MIRSFLALGVSTAVRLLVGLVLFALIAREWGAARFGEFMYLFSVSTLLVLACEFGFSQQILKEVGKDPSIVGRRLGELFAAKIWLTAMAWIALATFAILTGLSKNQIIVLILLMAAASLMSYSDFMMAGFRAIGLYSNEAVLTLRGNLVYFILGAGAVFLGLDMFGVAVSLVLGRTIHLLLTVVEYRKRVRNMQFRMFGFKNAWSIVRGGIAYGLDVAVATLFVNLDTVMISHLLGFESTGIYQAGARFYQGAALLPPIFAGVFLPHMARIASDRQLLSKSINRLYWLMLGAAILVTAGFVIGAHYFEWVYPDPSLRSVGELLPWFGLLVLVRFNAAAQGITVTALGGQAARALMFVVALLVMAVSAYPLLNKFGVVGMVFANCLAYAALAAMFWIWSEKQGINSRASLGTTMFASATIAILILKFGN